MPLIFLRKNFTSVSALQVLEVPPKVLAKRLLKYYRIS